MREIKFRAWCTFERKMYNEFYIDDHAKFAFMHELIDSARDRYKMMQYTGFKDKNGIDIYEGDIILIYNDDLKESDSRVGEVSWCNGCFFSGDEDLLGNVHFRAAVIGNVYEDSNRESIESSKQNESDC